MPLSSVLTVTNFFSGGVSQREGCTLGERKGERRGRDLHKEREREREEGRGRLAKEKEEGEGGRSEAGRRRKRGAERGPKL